MVDQKWRSWKAKYKKTYSEAEDRMRYEMFLETDAMIRVATRMSHRGALAETPVVMWRAPVPPPVSSSLDSPSTDAATFDHNEFSAHTEAEREGLRGYKPLEVPPAPPAPAAQGGPQFPAPSAGRRRSALGRPGDAPEALGPRPSDGGRRLQQNTFQALDWTRERPPSCSPFATDGGSRGIPSPPPPPARPRSLPPADRQPGLLRLVLRLRLDRPPRGDHVNRQPEPLLHASAPLPGAPLAPRRIFPPPAC